MHSYVCVSLGIMWTLLDSVFQSFSALIIPIRQHPQSSRSSGGGVGETQRKAGVDSAEIEIKMSEVVASK